MAWVKPNIVDLSGIKVVEPPFLLNEVTARVFPLKANVSRLTKFCDTYLNMDIPPEIVRYTPALPYVYLVVLNYGSMSAASIMAQNAGWVAQHEVTFTVPLRRWRRENGTLVFKDWASVTPFIYVDDQLSQMTGREVYGWPKVLGEVGKDVSLWATHPRKPTRLFTLRAPIFKDAYAGQQQSMQSLLHIDYEPPGTFSEFPVDPWNPWSPLTIVPNAIRNSLSLMGEAVDILTALRSRGFENDSSLKALLAMAWKGGSYFRDFVPELLSSIVGLGGAKSRSPAQETDWGSTEAQANLGLPKLLLNNVTLKQFRDPERPDCACYQALVNSQMGVNRINQMGLLGDPGLLSGDPSGGYTIRLHQYNAQPIVEVLGIEVPRTEPDASGGPVAVLKPTLPIWSDNDLWYGAGKVICSRTNYEKSARGVRLDPHTKRLGPWSDETEAALKYAHPLAREFGQAVPPARDANPATVKPEKMEDYNRGYRLDSVSHERSTYNTTLGAASQAVAGPFHFPDMHIQVYPLLAEQAKLSAFVDAYLNETMRGMDPRLSFKIAGSYVYLVVSVVGDKLGTMWSAANNIGWWAEREVAFCIPVKWYQGEPGNEALISMAVIQPFVYADSGRAVITDREVNGRPSVLATIHSPKDVWNAKGPAGSRELLKMETEIFAAVNTGQKSTMGALLEIDEGDARGRDAAGGESWDMASVEDAKRKARLAAEQEVQAREAKSLALEMLAYQSPMNRITLKQYRDSEDISKACYQAAVHTERAITRIYDIREIEQPVHVRINRVPGHPLVETFGLKVKSVVSRNGQIVEALQPIRPFWMHVAMKEELGRVIGSVVAVDTEGRRPSTMSEREKIDSVDSGVGKVVLPQDKWTKEWAMSHPWFQAGAAASGRKSDSGGEPFFRLPGAARVGPSLGDEADERHQHLAELCTDWLRRSLTNELAWASRALRGNPKDQNKVYEQMQPLEKAGLERLQSSLSAGDYCSGASLKSLLAISTAIRAARPDLQSGLTDSPEGAPAPEPDAKRPNAPGSSAQGRESAEHLDFLQALKEIAGWLRDAVGKQKIKNVHGAEISPAERELLKPLIGPFPRSTIENFDQAVRQFGALSEDRRDAAASTFTRDSQDQIQILREIADPKADRLEALARAHLTRRDASMNTGPGEPDGFSALQAATRLIEPLRRACEDWRQPSRWSRLSHHEAGKAINQLEELQIVLESILSSEWGSDRRRRPDQGPPATHEGKFAARSERQGRDRQDR